MKGKVVNDCEEEAEGLDDVGEASEETPAVTVKVERMLSELVTTTKLVSLSATGVEIALGRVLVPGILGVEGGMSSVVDFPKVALLEGALVGVATSPVTTPPPHLTVKVNAFWVMVYEVTGPVSTHADAPPPGPSDILRAVIWMGCKCLIVF